ncbi:TPA: hypothetical protein JLG68_001373 [Escherichia coli]|nr:hypothetical protein [Escherichia coli]
MKLKFDAGKVPLETMFDCFAEPEKAFLEFHDQAIKAGHTRYEATSIASGALDHIRHLVLKWIATTFKDDDAGL